MGALEKHVGVVGVSEGEGGCAIVGGGEGVMSVVVAGLIQADLADLREGLGLAGEGRVGEVAGVEVGEVIHRLFADGIEEIEAADFFELGAKIAEHESE